MANHELVAPRHIQNYSEASALEPHWGYLSRALPCTNDPGSCAYLDLVYHSHDLSMLYTGIFWSAVLGILLLWAVAKRAWTPSRRADGLVSGSISARTSSITRSARAFESYARRILLPDAPRSVFGRTTRLQVLILAILAGYLLIVSFAGITYQHWVTPVKNSTLHNYRSSLGPFSDRIGVLAYALTPLSVLLSSRESILSLVTGVPYQSFMFLHRWLGYIIFIQAAVHTIGWTVIEVALYQPQPKVAIEWIKELYIIWGVVATLLILMIVVLSTPWAIRLTGYEFFRKSHYALAMIYIGACWGHWYQLQCFLLPGLLIWFVDRGVRLARTALIHYQYLPDGSMGFQPASAALTHFADPDGDVVRMDFTQVQDAWKVGQHYYLCFPESTLWQSHPFTPLNPPQVQNGVVTHSYVFRAKGGETKKVADIALRKVAESPKAATTPVVLTGPYGEAITESLTAEDNVLCVAGGTGISYVLPVLLEMINRPAVRDRKIQLIWAIRRKADLRWAEQEISTIQKAAGSHGVDIHIYVTREAGSPAPSLQKESEKLDGQSIDSAEIKTDGCCTSTRGAETPMSLDIQRLGSRGLDRHPDLEALVTEFVENTVRGPTRVFGSGPGGIISSLRDVVAVCNSGAKVRKGNERFDVSLTCDDRLEW